MSLQASNTTANKTQVADILLETQFGKIIIFIPISKIQ